ncbi:hypothetical protein C2E23DRAFT_4780 [Lenzites betulinus]|nr:hypothetical protein C2E23DRAFT_4780 [Lenzites betulinus]
MDHGADAEGGHERGCCSKCHRDTESTVRAFTSEHNPLGTEACLHRGSSALGTPWGSIFGRVSLPTPSGSDRRAPRGTDPFVHPFARLSLPHLLGEGDVGVPPSTCINASTTEAHRTRRAPGRAVLLTLTFIHSRACHCQCYVQNPARRRPLVRPDHLRDTCVAQAYAYAVSAPDRFRRRTRMRRGENDDDDDDDDKGEGEGEGGCATKPGER